MRIAKVIALAGIALAIGTTANADSTMGRHKEWQTLNAGNKLSVPLYREVPDAPHALTGDLERKEPVQCRRELQTSGNKLTMLVRRCSEA